MTDVPPSSPTDKPAPATDKPAPVSEHPQQWQTDAASQAWTKESVTPATSPSTAGGLPHLTLDGQEDHSARTPDAAPSQPQPSGRQSWTVAIDLTTDLGSATDASDQYGAHSQFKQLSDLAEQTKGKDVTMVVQVPHEFAGGEGEDPKTIDRYVIRNGQMQKLESEESQGIATNMEHLLQRATEVAPSDKIALIAQGHGRGGDGIAGGTGSASLEETTDAIKSGLKGSGHDRLDVLDLDSCEMSTTKVLGQVSAVASRVVASEEPEHADVGHDAQNLKTVMSDLLQHPDMSAKDLSDDFVHAADRGANGTPSMGSDSSITHTGTDTLASFDTAKYGKFSGALDGLGAALTKASADDKNRAEIQKLIDGTEQLPLDPQLPKNPGTRDLTGFCQSLKAAVDSGTIKDTDGSIRRSADAVLTAEGDMTTALHVDHSSVYGKLGGLDTFIPGSEARDDRAKAAGNSFTKVILDMTDPDHLDSGYARRGQDVAVLDLNTRVTGEALSPEGQRAFAPVLDAVKELKDASTREAFDKANGDLHKAALALTGTAAERDIFEREVALQKESTSMLVDHRVLPGMPHWNEFVHEMAGLT